MWIAEFGHLDRGQHLKCFAIEDADGSQIVADPELLSVGRENDVVGLAETVRTRELFTDDGHSCRIDGGEGSSLLSISSLTFVGHICDLFIRRKPDTVRTASGRR